VLTSTRLPKRASDISKLAVKLALRWRAHERGTRPLWGLENRRPEGLAGSSPVPSALSSENNSHRTLEMIRSLPMILVLLLRLSAACQDGKVRLGEVEFFGTSGIDLQTVRSAVPAHEGDEFSFEEIPALRFRIKESIKQRTGIEPTDVAPVCCDGRGSLMVFIGLPGKNSESFAYRPQPKGSIGLSEEMVNLYQQEMVLGSEAVQKQSIEDRSKGYALSVYPPLRAKQLAMREYAVHNGRRLCRVLGYSADSQQRTIAAQFLGYANQDHNQITCLVRASRDRDEGVRNNAVRALAVLAQSNVTIATRIPAAGFVSMLNSGIWTDRNKATSLLSILTMRRNSRLLLALQSRALDSLIEMARWQNPGHADSARTILGRIARIPEDRLQKLLAAHDVDGIFKALPKPPGSLPPESLDRRYPEPSSSSRSAASEARHDQVQSARWLIIWTWLAGLGVTPLNSSVALTSHTLIFVPHSMLLIS